MHPLFPCLFMPLPGYTRQFAESLYDSEYQKAASEQNP